MLSVALVSLDAAGTSSGNSGSMFGDPFSFHVGRDPSGQATLSADGQWMTFQSDATDLVGGVNDTNKASDVFVRNLQSGQTRLVSATPDGKIGNGRSFQPILSPYGRYVAFLSAATDLSSTTASGQPGTMAGFSAGNLYVRDLQTQTTTLVDTSIDGRASDGYATGKVIFSPDGKSLAFTDTSTDLTATPPSNSPAPAPIFPGGGPVFAPENIYLHDLASRTTTAVSVTHEGTLSQGNANTYGPGSELIFSPDGERLAFTSTATDLTANPPDNTPASGPVGGFSPVSNLYVRDLSAGTTALISATPDGHIASGSSTSPLFSPDGTRLAFLSTSTNLTSEPAGSTPTDPFRYAFVQNLFVRDLAAGTTTLASVTTGNALSAGTVSELAFSPDGRSLAFIATANDLTNDASAPTPITPGIPPESLPYTDPMSAISSNVFVRDLAGGTTTAVSLATDGKLSFGYAYNLRYGPDGKALAYLSNATTLTANPYTPPPAPPLPPTPDGMLTLPTPVPVPLSNLFLYDPEARTTSLVSVTPDGKLSDSNISTYSFSPDGRQIAFTNSATDLTHNPPDPSVEPYPGPGPYSFVPTSTNNVFVRDLTARTTTLVTVTPEGTLSYDPSFTASPTSFFGPDGRSLFFTTGAPLVASDGNSTSDVYAASTPFATSNEIHFLTWQYNAGLVAGTVDITVVRNAPQDGPASVKYSVQDGTARAGDDFTGTSGTLTFEPGQSTATFTIPLNPARSSDAPKTATLVLSDPIGAALGYPTSVLNLGGPPVSPPVPISTPDPRILLSATTSTTPETRDRPWDPWNGALDIKVFPARVADASVVAPVVAADVVGPVVTRVSLQTSRRRIAGLTIHFNEALAASGANLPANYSVRMLVGGRRLAGGPRKASEGRAVKIATSQYDPAARTVSLTFRSPMRAGTQFQLKANGGPSGLTDPDGNALNSLSRGAPGRDYVYTANPRQI